MWQRNSKLNWKAQIPVYSPTQWQNKRSLTDTQTGCPGILIGHHLQRGSFNWLLALCLQRLWSIWPWCWSYISCIVEGVRNLWIWTCRHWKHNPAALNICGVKPAQREQLEELSGITQGIVRPSEVRRLTHVHRWAMRCHLLLKPFTTSAAKESGTMVKWGHHYRQGHRRTSTVKP